MAGLRYKIIEEDRKGTVRWYSVERSFGFIIPERENESDIFLHSWHVKGSWCPMEGDPVVFKLGLDYTTGRTYAVEIYYGGKAR